MIAAIIAIAGLNLITYAQTRYIVTDRLLTKAQAKMNSVIEEDGFYKETYPEGLPNRVTWALYSLGGRYHWHNEGLQFSVLGCALMVCGYVVARTGPKNKANKSS